MHISYRSIREKHGTKSIMAYNHGIRCFKLCRSYLDYTCKLTLIFSSCCYDIRFQSRPRFSGSSHPHEILSPKLQSLKKVGVLFIGERYLMLLSVVMGLLVIDDVSLHDTVWVFRGLPGNHHFCRVGRECYEVGGRTRN